VTPHGLSEVFHQHADPPEIPHTARMDGLRTRVRKVRRRRAFVAVACVAIALAGGALVTTPSLLDSQPAAPEPFPEYVSNSRVLAQTSGHTPDPLAIRFTPTIALDDVRVIFSCSLGKQHTTNNDEALSVLITVDGKEVDRTTCQDGEGALGGGDLSKNLRTGQPALVRMTVLGHMFDTPSETTPTPPVDRAADDIALRLAIGEHLEVTEYPLPPPPEEPVRVDDQVRDDADIILRADPADPNRPRKVVVPWRGVSWMSVWTGSPGRIRVLVGGTTAVDLSNYDYSLQGHVIHADVGPTDLVLGQLVEIEVVLEGARGDWVVMLAERD
jgi:hypothetical protein